MERIRKTALLTVVLSLLISLSACGGKSSGSVYAETMPPSAEPIQSAEPSPSPEPTPLSYILPNGSEVLEDAESICISGFKCGELADYAFVMEKLPALKTVELGDIDSSVAEELCNFMAAFPELEFNGTYEILGQGHDISQPLSLDVSLCSHEDVTKLCSDMSVFKNITELLMGSDEINDFSFEDIAALEAAAPNAAYSYDFEIFGNKLSVNTKKLNFSQVRMDDNGETVRRALRCMPYADYLDMDSCGVDNEHMAEIRDEFPQVEVIWRIRFGTGYSVRTNVERIFASNTYYGGELTGENTQDLKYCTKARLVDVGHNQFLDSVEFVRYMPDLEVFIIADNKLLTDLSPFENCTKLEYLELISAIRVESLEPLRNLTELKHLNIGNMSKITDISPLFNLTKLERLWIGDNVTEIPPEQIEEMQSIVPDCIINTTAHDVVQPGWRYTLEDPTVYTPRYALLREQFGYDDIPYTFSLSSYDPYCHQPAPTPEE